jgi:CubicO group peptidase (beta-lactamase class C family)
MAQNDELAHPLIDAALAEAIATTEVGIQVAAYLNGELIVDAWAGIADPDRDLPVGPDTLFCPFSVTKAVTATALHIQAERGLVDYDTPVAAYWPSFGANGKDAITVRHVLTHQSGVPWMPDGVTPELQADWDWMIRGFEEMEPSYPVGTNCYHALGWGWIIAEVIHRTDPMGRGFAQFVREELLIPIGARDMFFGLPRSEDHRLARLVGGIIPENPPFPMFFHGMPHAVHPSAGIFNLEVVRRTVHPGAGVLTNARSMAAIFGMLANMGSLGGARILSPERVQSFLTPRENADATDLYLDMRVPVSAYGYYLSDDTPGMIPIITPRTPILWMPGAGSSVGWAELDQGLGVAITHNHMSSHAPPPCLVTIAQAVRAVAAEKRGATG